MVRNPMSITKLVFYLLSPLFISLLLPLALASPDTYYVAPWGDDSNPGTRDKPWKSPGLSTRKMKPGDTLVILGGRYILEKYDDDILMPPSGSPNAWTVIVGEKGNRPVLAGRGDLIAAIDISGKSYVRIENLEITSDNGAEFRDGIQALNGPVSHIVLKDLYIHHIDEFGINIGDVDDMKILNCSITHTGFGSIGGPAGQLGGWRNVLIKDCYLAYSGHYYRGGPGPSPYDRPDGFGIEASAGPIEIARTIVEHNRGDGLDSKANNTYIHECIVANNFADGIKLWGSGSRVENTLIYGRGDGRREQTPWSAIVISSEKPGSFEIIGVTVDDEVGGNYLMHVQYDYDVPVILNVKNTIFSARGPDSPIFIREGVSYSFDGCLFYFPESAFVLVQGERSYGSSDLGDLGVNNSYGDPLFIKTGFGDRGNYHLREGSPAIDLGVQVALSFDLDGALRPHGAGFDAGAYEYGSSPLTPLTQPEPPSGEAFTPTESRGGAPEVREPAKALELAWIALAVLVVVAVVVAVMQLRRPRKTRGVGG
ncbi:MAG: right-handed parallel beta-helix repeat-containing protein [Thermofilaceae archaeon]